MPAIHVPHSVSRAPQKEASRSRGDPGRARRRRALLQLAERHGEVRIVVRGPAGPVPHAADLLELLDELNEAQRLRWGGVRKQGDVAEIVYLQSRSCVEKQT